LIITNKFNVPKPLVTLASKEYYSKGDSQYSVTELMSPPRVRRLQAEHDAERSTDVTEMLWNMMGSALHVVMERGLTEGFISEERIFTQVDGVTISGAIDLQEQLEGGGVGIIDYKFTSAWAVMANKIDWEQQLNVYKWLVETVKRQPVKRLQICAIVRDFDRHSVREGYPESQICMVEIPMWDAVKAETYIRERLELHRNSKISHDLGEPLPFCAKDERWERETVFAVKKAGGKRALKVFQIVEEAITFAAEKKGYVETRAGESVRCAENYCGVNKWCEQYQSTLKEENETD
jgi:hypothetical protein